MTSYKDLISRFSEQTILVVGDIMLDRYSFYSTENSREIVSEFPGKRAYNATEVLETLGGAGNVAANLSSLTSKTTLVGIVGDDGYSYSLQQLVEKGNVEFIPIRDISRPTTTKFRIYIDNQFQFRIDSEDAKEINSILVNTIRETTHKLFEKASALLISDYAKGVMAPSLCSFLVGTAKEMNIPVVVDCKPKSRNLYRGATLVAPNDIEAEMMIPGFLNDLPGNLSKLHDIFGSQITAVTLGEDGIAAFDGTQFVHVAGRKVKAKDPVGAGDTVRAALALGLSLKLPLKDVLELARDISAIVVQKIGTGTVSANELLGCYEKGDFNL